MSDTSAPATPSSAWPGMIPAQVLKEWRKVDPDFPARLLTQIEHDARHLRRMAWARLTFAVVLSAASLGSSVLLAMAGAAPYGLASSGAGTLMVVAILLTGRPPAVRQSVRSRRPSP